MKSKMWLSASGGVAVALLGGLTAFAQAKPAALEQ